MDDLLLIVLLVGGFGVVVALCLVFAAFATYLEHKQKTAKQNLLKLNLLLQLKNAEQNKPQGDENAELNQLQSEINSELNQLQSDENAKPEPTSK